MKKAYEKPNLTEISLNIAEEIMVAPVAEGEIGWGNSSPLEFG